MLIKAGFRVEGIIEDALFYPDGFHDIVLYGMLRRRCRWL
jgi:RimJ/RimL family protein N-acetyltransferase